MATMSPPASPTVSKSVVADKPSAATTSHEMADSLDVKDVSSTAATSTANADTNSVEDESSQPPRCDAETTSHVDIRYTVDCLDTNGRTFKISQNDKPLDIQVSSQTDSSPNTPTIELITLVDVRSKRQDSEESSEKKTEATPPKDLEDYKIDRVYPSSLHVHSTHLTQILRKVVEYYPSQNLVGETIIIPEPFAVLAHHADQLSGMLSHDNQNETTSLEENTEMSHLSVLLNFMSSHVKPKYEPAKKRLMHPTTPTVAFKDVWYLLRPGLKAYFDFKGIWVGCIIETVLLMEKDTSAQTPERWEVTVWFMDIDYVANEVGPQRTNIYVNTFDGEREVTKLPVYPCDYYDRNDKGLRKRNFEARGQRMQKLIWSGHQLLHHDGEIASLPGSTLTDTVIVGSVNVHGIEYPDLDRSFIDTNTPDEPPSIPDTKLREQLSYRLRPKKHGPEYMTQEMMFMMCPIHLAFVLSTKTWVAVNIDNTKEIESADVPPKPILDESSHDIIQALAEYQLKGEKPWSADFIRDKGEGVVVMLHGPPGVGKTYTVESIALRMGRPLITLSIAEIGIKEDQVQAQLSKWLALAEGWQAILLIDECDIFLERREAFDIARNGVVAAFLRNIEYFSGLLFLTTNRVGHIDEAFMSRVHAIIHFQPLNEASRKVLWKSLLDKVHRDRPGKIAIHNEAIKYLESQEMLQMDWNGREIRNAMQTAIALAEQDAKRNPYYQEGQAVIVLKTHFEAVQRLNRSFKDYLTSIRQEDQNRRARMYYLRNDTFDKTTEPHR